MQPHTLGTDVTIPASPTRQAYCSTAQHSHRFVRDLGHAVWCRLQGLVCTYVHVWPRLARLLEHSPTDVEPVYWVVDPGAAMAARCNKGVSRSRIYCIICAPTTACCADLEPALPWLFGHTCWALCTATACSSGSCVPPLRTGLARRAGISSKARLEHAKSGKQ